MKKTIAAGIALVVIAACLLVPPAAADPGPPVEWFAEDTITKGDWFFNPIGSPIGVYGSYAHILPASPTQQTQVPIGVFSVPVGFDIGNPSTWNLLSQPPFLWTANQVSGLNWYQKDAPYWDEYVTQSPPVTYTVSGTRTCQGIAPKGLVNTEGGANYTRAACWFAGSGSSPPAINLTLNNLGPGAYLLSFYILDYDDNNRAEDLTITLVLPGLSITRPCSGFENGLYENFFVYLVGTSNVDIIIAKTAGANAVLSGVFLSTTSRQPVDPTKDELDFDSEDSTTQGNWIGTYGDLGFIKCAWNVPQTKVGYATWNPAYDHSSGLSYTATTSMYAWTDRAEWIQCVQYPIFEWAWSGWYPTRPADLRAAYYTSTGQWRLACWDDGGERCQPVHGFEDFHLTFPQGTYLLSFYGYDYERDQRQSLEYVILDQTGTIEFASKQISGAAFDEGIYEIFKVVAPPGGLTIIARVYNDAGHPSPNLNALLSGIFVDKVCEPPPDCHITADPGPTVCEGTTVTLTEDGGDAVSWLWSTGNTTPSISVTTSGTYSVTVTDMDACQSTCQIEVTVNPLPDCHITADPGPAVCEGTTVTLTEDGGDAVSWLWSTSDTTQSIVVTSSGTYTVTVTDANGCQSTCGIGVTVNTLPNCHITADPGRIVCEGKTGTLTENGHDAVSWAWSTGETTQSIKVTTGGTYSVTITDHNGCSSTCSIEIKFEPWPLCESWYPPSVPATSGPGVAVLATAMAGLLGWAIWRRTPRLSSRD